MAELSRGDKEQVFLSCYLAMNKLAGKPLATVDAAEACDSTALKMMQDAMEQFADKLATIHEGEFASTAAEMKSALSIGRTVLNNGAN